MAGQRPSDGEVHETQYMKIRKCGKKLMELQEAEEEEVRNEVLDLDIVENRVVEKARCHSTQ